MTVPVLKRLVGALALSAGVLAVSATAQWTSDKPPVLTPEDYPPLATEDPPDQAKTTAQAQTQAQSQPADPTQATGAPQSLAPASGPGPVTVTDREGQPVPNAAPVQVDTLGTPEGGPVGLIDSTRGGYGDHLWSGSDRAQIEDLMAKAGPVSADPVLRQIAKRVFLTKAAAPPGQAPKAFARVRIQILLEAGLIDEAGAIAAVSTVPNDAAFARLQAEAILLANRGEDACGPITAARASESDLFWMQLRLYCASVTGDSMTADLTKEILKAQGRTDPAFDTLLEGLVAKKPVPPGAIAKPTAMHIFLLRQNGLPVTGAVAAKMGTAANLLAARDSRNGARARFEAADRIATTGALSAAELIAIADAQDIPLSRFADAADAAPKLSFFAGQALLRRAAMVETRPDEKAHLAYLALTLGEKAGLLPLAAALQADVIAAVKSGPGSQLYARSFAGALLMAGRSDTAAKWATHDPVMKVALAVASGDKAKIAAVQRDLSAFAAAVMANPRPADADLPFKALLLGFADVLGEDMPPDAEAASTTLQSQMWEGQRPGPGLMRTIEEFVAKPERRGEGLLLLTRAVRQTGLRDMAPDAAIALVRILADMGDRQSAKALAVEALGQYVPPPLPPPVLPAPSQ